MISIYGWPRSSAGRCFWCLEELGLSYERKPLDFKTREHKSEDFLKINPNGKIPVLIDGDYKIWESVAINFYLAEKYKPELLGKNIEDRGHVHQWSVWALAELQAPLIDIFIQMVFVPEDKRDLNLIEKAQGKLPNLLNILDQSLNGKSHIVGDSFSIADINLATVVALFGEIKMDISEYAHIQKWRETISQREGFKKYLALCES